MRLTAIIMCAVLAVFFAAAPASAEKRVALVIGNASYKNAGQLANPTKNSAAIAAMLKNAGYEVVEKTNVGIGDLRAAIADFSDTARDADIAVVYYSGHGIEVDGNNYLIPIDAVLNRDIDVRYETYSLDDLVKLLDPVKRLRVVILDACRDNPFSRTMKRTVGSRAVGKGLAPVDIVGSNTLIGFATRAGTTASDGDGNNSPYAIALLKHIATPGLDLRQAYGHVRDEVLKLTRNRQEPAQYGSLGGAFLSLVDIPAAPATSNTPPVATGPSEAERAWNAIQQTNSIAVIEEFLKEFGDSFYARYARVRLAELKRSQIAVVAPQVPQPAPPPRTEPTPQAQQAIVVPPVAPPASPSASQPVPAVGMFDQARKAAPLTAAEERSLKPKDSFKECDSCAEMTVVPSGSFTMGSPSNEEGRISDEGPQRKVNFARSFAIGKFAVTFDEWDACVSDGGCNGYKPSDSGWGRGKRPAINVSWRDAKSYVAWLSRKTGKTYRLLSESEREYVARAGTTTSFWWGSSISKQQGNYGSDKTVPVDSFPPNPWGLYQIHGNVWEWIEDCVRDSYSGVPTDGSASTRGDCSRRGLRGGSWLSFPSSLRSATRTGHRTDNRSVIVGFRLGRTLSDTP